MKNKLKNFLALMFGVVISFLIAEVILRHYDPFGFRQRADSIVLQPNSKYTIRNDNFVKLDSLIVHTKNALGFRGPEKPADFDNWISIITIGGSTTECYYLSDGKDWSALLGDKLRQSVSNNIWVNNAGMDGHSTFGHTILLRDHIATIRPDYAVFLVGCNDVERNDLNEPDKINYDTQPFGWKNYLRNNSAVVNLLTNLKRNYQARRKGLVHSPFDLATCEILDSVDNMKIQEMLAFHQRNYTVSYEKRLTNLIALTKTSGIIPVLITQPALVGVGSDDMTNADLEKVVACNRLGGKAHWLILETYNDITRKVAREQEILLIDLAAKMPKSSRFFYDCEHFTNAGAEVVAQIVFEELNCNLK